MVDRLMPAHHAAVLIALANRTLATPCPARAPKETTNV